MAEQTPRETYREFASPSHLRDRIVCFWHRPAGGDDGTTRILPDGCIDLIWEGGEPPIIAGPMTVAVMPTIARGSELLGVRFRPGSAPVLLGASATELLNEHLPLRAVWPGPLHQPWAEAGEQGDLAERMRAIAVLIANHYSSAGNGDPLADHGAHWLAANPAGRLEDLIRLSGLSERQVRRRFEQAIGYGPKRLQRILRLQRLLWLASQARGARPSLSQLAFTAGYADQPHMTREVLALTGSPPGKLLLGSEPHSAVSDLFKTSSR